MARGDLTDDEWDLIGPHLPLGTRGPIPDLRSYFSAIMWRFRSSAPWRDVPEHYGSWSTIYDRSRLWAATGLFQRLMDAMTAQTATRDDVGLGLVSVDTSDGKRARHTPQPPPTSVRDTTPRFADATSLEDGRDVPGLRPGNPGLTDVLDGVCPLPFAGVRAGTPTPRGEGSRPRHPSSTGGTSSPGACPWPRRGARSV
ncbi:transposase [Nocardiopsis sp. Huas11]|uniref:transposase n=1 Tax=Nocardiopsis sp. Huas11 TaxID=2183912 RepID=UPI0013154774